MSGLSSATDGPTGAPDVRGRLRGETLDGLEHELGRVVRRARRVIGVRAAHVHPDLHPAAYLMLALLGKNGPMRSSEMTEVFDIDKGAVSRQVHQLVHLGLATRAPDPGDGRATIVAPSEEGLRRLAAVKEVRRALLSERLADWTQDEVDTFVTHLARYNASLEPDPR